MRLQSLRLEQFRSYRELVLDLSETNVHVLTGANGAGKTNVLEAVSVLSLTKSCLRAEETDIVHWGAEYYRVQAAVRTAEGAEKQLEVVSQLTPRKQKACFINDVRIGAGDMVGALPVTVFLPQDLELFTGAPGNRRAFLDQLLCQVSPEYVRSLSEYQKVLKQRNALLKSIAEGEGSPDGLAVWDHRLAELGAQVTVSRLELIEMLQCTFLRELQSLGEQWSDASLVYERRSRERELSALQEELASLLEDCRERDITLQSTTRGPHRDDWRIDIEGRDFRTFASRGQQRTAILALLFLEVSYLELRRGEQPVVLLDDVFSELDPEHQSALLSSLTGHQVLITTTHVPEAIGDAMVWAVEDGKVWRVKGQPAVNFEA